jgi:uncharacterized membrane protein
MRGGQFGGVIGMQNQPDQSREKKRAQFSEATRAKSKMTPILVAILVALVAVAVYAVWSSSDDKPASTAVATSAGQGADAARAAEIKIPVADVASGKAKFFDYTLANNKPVRFFVLKSSDGVYRAALDACDVCYHAKKGYRQEGDDMVCNNCGLKFHSALINEVSGGCNPVGLPRAVEGDYLVIKTAELERRGGYF